MQQNLTANDLKNMQDVLRSYREQVASVANRIARDVVQYNWIDKEKSVINFRDKWTEVCEGVFGRAIDTVSENISTTLHTGVEGSFIPMHSHLQTQTMFVVEGEIELSVDNRSIVLVTNDSAVIKPFAEHSVRFLKSSMLFNKYVPREYHLDITKPSIVVTKNHGGEITM